MRESKINYNPSITVKENAKRNGVSEAAVRYYIKVNHLDRRYDKKISIIEDCRKYLKKHPEATRTELQKKTGHSLSTIRQYWDYISTEKELIDFDRNKAQKRLLRQGNNYYATHPSVTQDLLSVEMFKEKILEPFCGGGSMADVIKANGYEVEAYDIIDRGYGKQGDFFQVDFADGEYDIISNPPYDESLIRIIKRCLAICNDKVAMLLPLIYLSGKARYEEVFKKNPPVRVYIYSERITIAKNGDFEQYADRGANKTIYAWFVWEKGYKGKTELRWLHNNKKEGVQEKPKLEETTILDGILFKPFDEFFIPVSDCIQFHSKALPENKVLSNHYECIITFRGVEFYGLEQLYAALNFSNSPNVLKHIMKCKSGKAAKKVCHDKYLDKRDLDFDYKRYRMIALCHLFKYLSVKEYRDRLRETYPQTLVECPNGRDYHYGMVQNLDTNIFEGNNCSGRTSMIVRDIMRAKEENAISEKEQIIGRKISEEEKEEVRLGIYTIVRNQYENDKQVLKDSQKLMSFIEKNHIPKVRTPHPKPIEVPIIDKKTKCLVVDFDYTVFDTSADDSLRKFGGEKDWNKIYETIPQYRLYEGWQEVFQWTKKNKVKVAVLSSAKRELIERAFKSFKLPCNTVVGYQPYLELPNAILGNMLMEKLNIRQSQIIYVGCNQDDDKQARSSQFRFIGASWDNNVNQEQYFSEKGIQTISNPKELIHIMEEAGWNK